MRAPRTLRWLMLVPMLLIPMGSNAASLLIDDFIDGPFMMVGQSGASLDDKDIQTGAMLGGDRYTALSSSYRQFPVSAELVLGTSVCTFNANTGPSGPMLDQGTFYAVYGVPLLERDFTFYSGFLLLLPVVEGTGAVEVRIRDAPNDYQAAFTAPISHAGSIFVPISGSGAVPELLSAVNQISMTFTALSDDFSVSVDRFSLIPEPSSLLMAMFGVAFACRRSKQCANRVPVTD